MDYGSLCFLCDKTGGNKFWYKVKEDSENEQFTEWICTACSTYAWNEAVKDAGVPKEWLCRRDYSLLQKEVDDDYNAIVFNSVRAKKAMRKYLNALSGKQ